MHFEHAILMFHPQHAFQHDGKFIEFGALAGLDPAAGRTHVRDAQARLAGVDGSYELVNDLRLVSRGFDSGWGLEESGHVFPLHYYRPGLAVLPFIFSGEVPRRGRTSPVWDSFARAARLSMESTRT
ncbi:MAG: hypothetical protein IANPNBLG_04267 [Bryobacteraceae bacterium]|nr:hypothetical protein [Bryobacteraceae bacterium]